MSGCASYVSYTNDITDDVTRSQSRSNFEIDISPSNFQLERQSKGQNIRNTNGYLDGIFNFWYHLQLKRFSQAQIGGYFENIKILNTTPI